MGDYINHHNIRVKCNIQFKQIHHLSVLEQVGAHALAEVSAEIEDGSLELSEQELNCQPIMIYSVRNNSEDLVFSGVIGRVCIERHFSYDTIQIAAYSTSWLMDLEQKSRSFQGIPGGSVMGLIQRVAKENSFQMICSSRDEIAPIPFIQYMETDWEFLLRLSTHLNSPVFPASDYHGKGIYIGFKENVIPITLTVSKEIWRMDPEQIGTASWRSRAGTYFEVVTSQILHLGQSVIYRNERLWVQEVSMGLENGVLQCTYKLAGKNYHSFTTSYNPHIKGVSLTATVLERQGERVKVHLDLDEEQKLEDAYPYLWLPEHGNLMYCMPEKGSKIRLMIPGEDERNAIGLHCVRQNGHRCEETQDTNTRLFAADQYKKITLQQSLIGMISEKEMSSILLQDGVGDRISSDGEILIQSKGKMYLKGNEVELMAPTEVTAIRRQLGAPTVVNLCHNLDAIGRYSTFKNLDQWKEQTEFEKRRGVTGKGIRLRRKEKERLEKEKARLELKLKELMEDVDQENTYELGATMVNIISAIPQCAEQDTISQITMGFHPITGRMKGD